MGNWNITIRGVGCHHNEEYPKDANKMAAEFVKLLEAAGHVVHEASITYGAEDVLRRQVGYQANGTTKTADEYLAERVQYEQAAKASREKK
jgi:hypothetical protein